MNRMTDDRVGEKAKRDRDKMKADGDDVVIASDDSFPASDAPSWTGVTGSRESPIAAEPHAAVPAKDRAKKRGATHNR
jgi:hypothetical protein